METNGQFQEGDKSTSPEKTVFDIPLNNNQVENTFMSTDVLSGAENKTEWDFLINQGTSSEPVSKWERESLFQAFDPLVHTSDYDVHKSENEDKENLQNENPCESKSEQTNTIPEERDGALIDKTKLDNNGHYEGDYSTSPEKAIPYNNNQVNEKFMCTDALSATEDKNEWDLLINIGTGSESVSKWERESLFQTFDPLVHTSDCGINESHEDLENDNNRIERDADLSSAISEELNDPNSIKPSLLLRTAENESNRSDLEAQPASEKPDDVVLYMTLNNDVQNETVRCETETDLTATCDESEKTLSDLSVNLHESEVSLKNESIRREDEPKPNSSTSDEIDGVPPQIENEMAEDEMIILACMESNSELKNKLATTEEDSKNQTNLCKNMAYSSVTKANEDNSALKTMPRVLGEYEKTMSSYVEKNNELKNKLAEAQEDIKNHIQNRNQAMDDLKHVEDAFSLLHQKYERVKGTLENFRKNEEILKRRDEELTLKLANRDKKYESLKEESELNLQIMMKDYDTKFSGLQSENLKLRAMIRKNEMAFETLGQNLEQKQKENLELNKLCEELIGGGLNVQ